VTSLLVLATLVSLTQAPADTALFPPRGDFLRMYLDCDEARWPYGTEERLVPKTADEIISGAGRLHALEERWRRYFVEHAGDSIPSTSFESWVYPLGVRGRLLDNFNNPREGGPHEALDIFVEREGAIVRAPVSGVVVAAGDQWRGGWSAERGGLWYEGDGLSRRAGNGLVIFDPQSGGYLYFAHLQSGLLVTTGDVVRAGASLGRVGHTGNASQRGHGKHLHFTYKRHGWGCGVDSVLVTVNPYTWVRDARRRMINGHQ
jgi:murein DD-endopeptidase MepM/ murein hydrolase activator NlpD